MYCGEICKKCKYNTEFETLTQETIDNCFQCYKGSHFKEKEKEPSDNNDRRKEGE